jgi:hypothetical protein
VVSADKLRKLWDFMSELTSYLCERRLERTVLRLALLSVKNCPVYTVFPSGMTSHSKIAQFNRERIRHLIGRRKHLIFKCKKFKISKIPVSFGKKSQGRSGFGERELIISLAADKHLRLLYLTEQWI